MKKGTFISFLFLILGIPIIALFSYYSYREAKRSGTIDKEIEALEQEAAKTKRDNEQLRDRIAYFETEDFKEEIAKEKLNLQKPDEHVVVIKPSPALEPAVEQDSQENKNFSSGKSDPNYIKWWDYFFK